MTGIKHDAGKILPDLVLGDFMIALEQAVFAGTFGAFKYEPKNFQQLENGEQRYAEAAFRHYLKRKKGEEFDPESGELHDAHELWCHIARLYFKLRDDKREFEKAIMWKSTGQYRHPTPNEHDVYWDDEPFWYSEDDARQIIWHLAQEQKGELDLQVIVREIKDYEDLVEVPVIDLKFETQGEIDDFVEMISSLAPAGIRIDGEQREFAGRKPNTFFELEGRHKGMSEDDYAGPPLYLYNYLNNDFYIGNGAFEAITDRAIKYEKPVPGLLREMPNTMFVEVAIDFWPEETGPYVIHDEAKGFLAAITGKCGVIAWGAHIEDAARFHKGCARQWIEQNPSCTTSMRPLSWYDLTHVVRAESGDFWARDEGWVDLEEAATLYNAFDAANKAAELTCKTTTRGPVCAWSLTALHQ